MYGLRTQKGTGVGKRRRIAKKKKKEEKRKKLRAGAFNQSWLYAAAHHAMNAITKKRRSRAKHTKCRGTGEGHSQKTSHASHYSLTHTLGGW